MGGRRRLVMCFDVRLIRPGPRNGYGALAVSDRWRAFAQRDTAKKRAPRGRDNSARPSGIRDRQPGLELLAKRKIRL